MIEDLVLEMTRCYFNIGKDFKVTITDYKKGVIGVDSNGNKLLLALSLKKTKTEKWVDRSGHLQS